MIVGILNKGDEVISVTNDFVAVRRKSREVDIVPFIKDKSGWRIDVTGIVTIGYGDNTITVEHESGSQVITF